MERGLAQAMQKAMKYTKNLKLNVGMQPQQSSETVLSHEYPLSALHPPRPRKEGTFSREGSPRPRPKRRSREANEAAFNLSGKYPQLRKDFQSENEHNPAHHHHEPAFNRTATDKVDVRHLASLLVATAPPTKELGKNTKEPPGKKSGHSYTYTHLNDDADKFSEEHFFRPQPRPKFRHSKSPSKERHIEHHNTTLADDDRRIAPPPSLPLSPLPHPEVGQLLEEIGRLERVVEAYQGVLLRLKHRYLEAEGRLKEKALSDHYVDVLKLQVERMQEANQRLAATVHAQRTTIANFHTLLLERVASVRDHYEQEAQTGLVLARENEFLKRLLLIAADNPETPPAKPATPEATPQPTQNAFLRSVARSVEEFGSKWSI